MSQPGLHTFGRFLLSGAFNTAATYALYLALLVALPYWLSYSVAYASGIVLAYYLSRHFVFGHSPAGRRALAFPLVYVAQYLVGLAVAFVWVDLLRLPAPLAPLAALAVTVPLTYLLTHWVFRGGRAPGARAAQDAPAVADTRERVRAGALRTLLLLLPPLLFALVVWLPFGFSLRGLLEEWDVLGLFTVHGRFFFVDGSTPMAPHAMRPLTVFPHAVAHAIAPDSFVLWHGLTIASLAVKGAAAGYLAWVVTRSFGWGLACSLLMLAYPADTMQLAFRGIHINMALALLLLAGALAVRAHYHGLRGVGVALGAAAGALFLASILMYEAAAALLPLPLLVLLAAEGGRGTLRRMRGRPELALLWLAAPALFLLHAWRVSAARATYQASIGAPDALAGLAAAFPKLFTVGAVRALAGGWFDAVRMVRTEFASPLYLVLAAAACCAAIVLAAALARRLRLQPELSAATAGPRLRALRLAAAGIVLMLLGYVPFLLSGAHMAITQRTYLFASPGAVFAWLAALVLLASLARRTAGAAFALMALAGLAAQLYQFHRYVAISEQQRTILRSIVESFPGDLGDRTLLLLDGSNRLNHTWMLRDNMQHALSYLYDRELKSVEICLMPAASWQRLDRFGRPGECLQEASGWRLRPAAPAGGPGVQAAPAQADRFIPAQQAVVLRIAEDGSIARDPALSAYRERLVQGDDPVARRYRAILLPREPSPLLGQFADGRDPAFYRTDFGRWWSIEEPIHGSGWREADWDIGTLRHDASAWTVSDTARLVFELRPAADVVAVRGWFSTMTPQPAGIGLRLNGQPLSAQWPDATHFEARVPASMLKEGGNVLEVQSRTASDYYGLGAKMTRLEVDGRR